MRNNAVLRVRKLTKRYGARRNKRQGSTTLALDEVSFMVEAGEFVGIMGPSGSGKSTLLNCISTIDEATGGQVVINEHDVSQMDGKELAAFRRGELGFVFQDANLLDTLTAFENIALALTIQKTPVNAIEQRVLAVAAKLSIEDVLQKYPYEMSGGQKQRVAAARAVVTEPRLILADEPTGSLDSKAAAQLLGSFEKLNETGSTLLMVTHDPATASYCKRIIFIKDGSIWGQLERNGHDRAAFFKDIVSATARLGEDEAHVC